MRFLPLVFSFLFLVACSASEQQAVHASEVCSAVTTENWSLSNRFRSPKETCNGSPWVYGEGFEPCTLGGVPFLCKDREGTVSVYQLDGSVVVHLEPVDKLRIGEGLKFIR